MDLLEIAGYGTDAIGFVLGGWYASDMLVKQNQKTGGPLVASLLAEPPSAAPSSMAPPPESGREIGRAHV